MAYIGKSPSGTGVRIRYYFTQTSGGATSISGTDDNNKTLSFSDGEYVDVYLNGVSLVAGTDYNTTTANTIGGLSALANGDVVEVVVYDIFTVADTVSQSSGGTFNGAVIMSNGLTVDDDGAVALTVDRATSDGNVAEFQQDGSTLAQIGTLGVRGYFSADNAGISPYQNVIYPVNGTGTAVNNTVDIGHSSYKFKDLYLAGDITANNLPVANTPVVVARKSSNQSLSRGTWTKITGFDVPSSTDATVDYDPDSVFDGSRFTVPSGGAGRYLCSANIRFLFNDAGNDGEHAMAAFYVNGGQKTHFTQMSMDNGARHMSIVAGSGSVILNLTAGQYVEVYAYMVDDVSSGTLKVQGEASGGSQVGFFRID